VRQKPIGVGAVCAGCENRRRVLLRHYELGLRANAVGSRWVVLCHNCAAFADALDPPARSIEGLRMRLQRDRRWGDRRIDAVGGFTIRAPWLERRRAQRRTGPDDLFDATELAEELIVEIEAAYEADDAVEVLDAEEVTGIFRFDNK
jgi:hypothetical protein